MNTHSVDDEKIKALKGKGLRQFKVVAVVAMFALPVIAASIYFLGEWANPAENERNVSTQVSSNDSQTSPLPTVSREEVQQPLSDLKIRVTELVNNTAKMDWNPAASASFSDALDSLYLQYAAGSYNEVQLGISTLTTDLDKYDIDYLDAYENKHREAEAWFEQGRSNKSELSNAETLRINPSYEPALILQSRLEVYDRVNRLLKQIKRAEAERNLNEQYELLAQVLNLDPYRSVEQQKFNAVETQIKAQRFSKYISKGLNAIENQDIKGAELALSKATKLDPKRSELRDLASQIARLKSDKGLESIHAQLFEMDKADNWQGVYVLSEKAASQYHQDTLVKSYLDKSTKILEANELLDIYISKPSRVYDNNIRKVVAEDLVFASSLKTLSASLDRKINQVEKLAEVSNTKVSVWFESDDKTNIKVIKVGHVGKTDGRFVELLPGLYQVEGSREGYKNTLLTLNVLPDKENKITVICDEKIR